MTNAINSVSSLGTLGTTSGASSSKLSEDTKKKLQALGLDPTKYSCEAEAQAAITAFIQQQQQQEGTKKTGGNGEIKTIKSEVQSLASEMGISVGNNDKIGDIMDKINEKISELQSSAGSDNNKLSLVNDYNNKFSAISSELDQLKAAKNMTGATALANYNKATHGFAA